MIYACLGATEIEHGFAAAYNLLTEEFVRLTDGAQRPLTTFPLRILYNTTRLLDFRTALQTHPQHVGLQEKLDGLVHVFTNYRLPVVTLKNLTLDEVCPIFERINSSGTPLSIYELMVAATWSKEFDLNDRANRLAASLETKDFDDIQGPTILKVLAAVESQAPDRNAIIGLRRLVPDALDRLVKRAKAALELAVDLIVTDFKVHSLDFLPYEAHLTILSSIFAQTKALTGEQLRRIRQWFWRTAFAEYYRGAADTFITRSLKEVTEYVLHGEGDVDAFGKPPSTRRLLALDFRKNSSGSRAFALALGKRKPCNLTNGAALDTYQALSAYNRHQFHHVYPRGLLRGSEAEPLANRLMNICMLAASENRAISDRDPCQYIPELISHLGNSATDVFQSNLLPTPDAVDYGTLEFREFVNRRALHAEAWIARLCEGVE